MANDNLRNFKTLLTNIPQVEIIVSSILNLARGLSLEVVAEGIETEAQFQVLKALGCPLIQGYWTGRPLPLAEIMVFASAPVAGVSGSRIGMVGE